MTGRRSFSRSSARCSSADWTRPSAASWAHTAQPRQDHADRSLTNNARPQWLSNAPAALDEAVADAYGWGDDWRARLLTDDEFSRGCSR